MVYSADVADGEVATVEGQVITLGTMNGVTVNNATVTSADQKSNNGVVHVIDAVILPSDVDLNSLLTK